MPSYIDEPVADLTIAVVCECNKMVALGYVSIQGRQNIVLSLVLYLLD